MNHHTNSTGVSTMAASSAMRGAASVEPLTTQSEGVTWPMRLTAALSVLPRLRMALAHLGRAGIASEIASGPAPITSPTGKPTEPLLSASEARLRARAVRVSNRNPDAVARYLAVHRDLKAACSEVTQ